LKQEQETEQIIDMHLDTVKNAKLFTDIEKHFSYLVHYNHVILTIQHIQPCENKIVSIFGASNTSRKAIRDTLSFFGINKTILQIYLELGKSKDKYLNDRYECGSETRPFILKNEWKKKIERLKFYDYKEGTYLWSKP